MSVRKKRIWLPISSGCVFSDGDWVTDMGWALSVAVFGEHFRTSNGKVNASIAAGERFWWERREGYRESGIPQITDKIIPRRHLGATGGRLVDTRLRLAEPEVLIAVTENRRIVQCLDKGMTELMNSPLFMLCATSWDAATIAAVVDRCGKIVGAVSPACKGEADLRLAMGVVKEALEREET